MRYARHTLDIDEVGEHIRQGKLPNSLTDTRYFNVKTVQASGLK